jgi:hypothetical protein
MAAATQSADIKIRGISKDGTDVLICQFYRNHLLLRMAISLRNMRSAIAIAEKS